MRSRNRQRGNTLIIALVMLTLLTFIAVTAINMSTTNIQIVGNMQAQEEAVAVAQQWVEAVSATSFSSSPPTTQTIDINGGVVGDGAGDYSIEFDTPECQWYTAVDPTTQTVSNDCYGSGGMTLCYWTIWNVRGTATDVATGASASVTQGVQAVAGLNNYLDYCE